MAGRPRPRGRTRGALAVAVALLVTLAPGCHRRGDDSPPGPVPVPLGLSQVERIDHALAEAASFLCRFQGADGAIRSATYSALEDGWSLTPLAMATLLFLPQTPEIAGCYRRGVDFVATMVDGEGKLRSGPEAPNYFVYSTALAVLVLNVEENQRYYDARDGLIEAIRGLQMNQALGWRPTDPSFGGWGYFPGVPVRPKDEVITDTRYPANLTATLYAVGALRLAGIPVDDPALVQARGFIDRCQNYAAEPEQREPGFDDGGFVFSPELADGNKAGPAGIDRAGRQRYHSYGSITADGLRALIRLDLPLDHPRVVAAASWLTSHFEVERTPGDFSAEDEYRRGSTYYYYVWSVAHALRLLASPTIATAAGEVRWAERLANQLLARQRDDGSWQNPFTEGREDDPIVATALAAAGLANARVVLTGEERSHKAPVEEPIPLPM